MWRNDTTTFAGTDDWTTYGTTWETMSEYGVVSGNYPVTANTAGAVIDYDLTGAAHPARSRVDDNSADHLLMADTSCWSRPGESKAPA